MSKRKENQRRRDRGNRSRASSQDAFKTYKIGDALVGGPAFNPLTGRFEFDSFPGAEGAIQVIGDPRSSSGEPRVREATLDDCVDDCPMCMLMREQILAGNPPQVMAFE